VAFYNYNNYYNYFYSLLLLVREMDLTAVASLKCNGCVIGTRKADKRETTTAASFMILHDTN